MTYLAHTENDQGQPHLLRDHLRGVGDLAQAFAANPALRLRGLLITPLEDVGLLRTFQVRPDLIEAFCLAQQARERLEILCDDFSLGREHKMRVDPRALLIKGRRPYERSALIQ